MTEREIIINRINSQITKSSLKIPEMIFDDLNTSKETIRKICSNIIETKFILDITDSLDWNELLLFGPGIVHLENKNKISTLTIEDLTEKEFQLGLEVLALKNDVFWNTKRPFVSFYTKLGNNSIRCSLVHKDITSDQKSRCFLRNIKQQIHSIEDFCSDQKIYSLLEDLIIKKKNIIICGETGCGKTTLVRSMLKLSDMNDHVVVIEDTKEIMGFKESQTSLLSNSEQSLNQLLTYSLRLSPDRIVLGEIRSHEALTLLLAMNTGHRGVLSTVHANSAPEALTRIALLASLFSNGESLPYKILLELVCKNIEVVIFLDKRSIKEIIEVVGSDGKNVFYETLFVKK